MAHQGLGERVFSLKSHVFSDNANNSTTPSIHQANCVGTQIYPSQNALTPPLQSSRLASINIPTANRTSDNFILNTRQEAHISREKDSRTRAGSIEHTSNSFELEDADVQINDSTVAEQRSSRSETSNVVSRAADKCLTEKILKRNPIVVITPASAPDNHQEMDSNVEATSNGEVDGVCLNDGVDTCSLSSVYSEDDIQTTDDDPCESDCASQPEEKTRKVSNWKKIRRVIHWSPFVQNFKKKYPWVQLAGHQGSFKAGENGTILKKTTDKEKDCLIKLMKDILRPYVPEYKKEVENDGEKFIQMQDLLQDFENPCIMDCKMGVRTYLEEELAKSKTKPRKDLYQKMVDVDPSEPTESENNAKAITKPRYMQWRERLSSSATLGFRIEGIKKGDQKPNKDFKKTKTKEDVAKVFTEYIENDPQLRVKYVRRLKAIRATLEVSGFFKSHEVIGSSLLFVHDANGAASIWMIDFGKTVPLQDDVSVDHRSEWKEGNHEDGYLWGLDEMIDVWTMW